MRDPNRIEKYITLLQEIWKQYPDWRFGQLICNINKEIDNPKLFYIEDEVLFKNVLREEGKNV